MPYQTQFSLSWLGDHPSEDQVMTHLTRTVDELQPGQPGFDQAVQEWRETLIYENPTTWDRRQAHLALVSSHWPQTLFTLQGLGEDPGDRWIEYHRNGLVQTAPGHMVFDDFNPEKLQQPRVPIP